MSWKRVQFVSNKGDRSDALRSSMTLNLNNSMSSAAINAKIDMLPKYIPAGKSITIQFADGTYTLGGALYFFNFWGPGALYIRGNTGEATSLHTNQAVILSTVAANTYGMYLLGIKCIVYVTNLRIDVNTAGGQSGLNPIESEAVYVLGSYFKGNSVSGAGYMIYNYRSRLFILNTYVDNSYCAFLNFICGYLASQNNSSTANNQYVLITIGATSSPFTGTQPASNAGSSYQQGGQ